MEAVLVRMEENYKKIPQAVSMSRFYPRGGACGAIDWITLNFELRELLLILMISHFHCNTLRIIFVD